MCGIAGAFWKTSRPTGATKVVDGMVRAIRHRGPDSDGRSSSNFAEVGFKRLSIIDLTTGDQPLTNETGDIECFLNGEIYNYQTLRKELVERGHSFQTSSDTEVLPHLYEECGEKMFAKLNGMFSICVIDHRRKLVLLARDHFGVKQMYYAERDEYVVFGSEVKAVLASGLFEPELDEASIVSYLTLFYSPQPHTLVKGVKKIPAGSVLKLQSGCAAKIEQYYRLPSEPVKGDLTEEESSERAAELLKQSVGLQLQADVPVGISLSGGIDSSAITSMAFASETAPSELIALTISWPDTVPEELACSKKLCEQLGLRQEIIRPTEGNFETDLPLLAWISDEPIADPATYSQFRVAQEAGNWVKVLLGGAGGDELFGGYGNYLLPSKKHLFASLPLSMQRTAYHLFAKRWLDEESVAALGEYRNSRFSWHCKTVRNISEADEMLLRSLLPESRQVFQNYRELFQEFHKYDAANQQMLVDLHTYLPEQVLPMADRATMAASVEGRVPFLDVPLVEFCYSISGRLKMGWPPVQKRLLKRALEKIVPLDTLQRRKSGMPSHFSVLMARQPQLIRQLLLRPDGCVKRYLPEPWLTGLVSSETAMRQNYRVLYALLIFEVWVQLFIHAKSYERPSFSIQELCSISVAAAKS